MIKAKLKREVIEGLGIYQAATLDGYWEERAEADLQYVFLLGQLHATRSIHSSTSSNSTRLRIRWLKKLLEGLAR